MFDMGEPPTLGRSFRASRSGVWKVGDRFWSSGHREFRILERLGRPEGDVPEAEDWSGIFVVERL